MLCLPFPLSLGPHFFRAFSHTSPCFQHLPKEVSMERILSPLEEKTEAWRKEGGKTRI
jgi:hypothetical protein